LKLVTTHLCNYIHLAANLSGSTTLFKSDTNGSVIDHILYKGLNPSPSVQFTFFDYDNDGYLEVFVANYPQFGVSQGNYYYSQACKPLAMIIPYLERIFL